MADERTIDNGIIVNGVIDDGVAISDGRRRRRELGRTAVIDAVIDELLEEHGPPTAERVAARSGVSVASVFRYFATLDDLRREGIQRHLERIDHLIAVPNIGEGSLTKRVDGVVSARLVYYERAAPIARLARRQAADVPELAVTLRRVRSTLTDQLDHQFDLELSAVTRATRRQTVGALATLTSFESWDQLTAAGFGRTVIAATWRRSITAILTADLA